MMKHVVCVAMMNRLKGMYPSHVLFLLLLHCCSFLLAFSLLHDNMIVYIIQYIQ